MTRGTDTVEFPEIFKGFSPLIELRQELLMPDVQSLGQHHDLLGLLLREIEEIEHALLDDFVILSVSLGKRDLIVPRTEDLKPDQVPAHAEKAGAILAPMELKQQNLLNLRQFTMTSVSQLIQPGRLQFQSQHDSCIMSRVRLWYQSRSRTKPHTQILINGRCATSRPARTSGQITSSAPKTTCVRSAKEAGKQAAAGSITRRKHGNP